MKKTLLFLLICLPFISHAQEGTLTNIQVSQRTDGSGFVDIYFDLSGSAAAYNMSLEASFDAGNSYQSVPATHLSGDVTGISPDNNKHLVWDGFASFPDTYSTQSRLKVLAVADNGNGPPPGEGVTDIDGNFYPTVIIGNQEWMAENLRTTRDANGNDITRYCYDDDETNCELYGGLYTWETVMNGENSSSSNPSGVQGICPTGWHVPIDAEWTELVNYLDSQGFPNSDVVNGAGNALKSCRQVGSPLEGCNTSEHPRWNSHGTHYGFDEFGFSALPGGYRNANGSFDRLGTDGYWWSSTEYSSPNAWDRSMSRGNGSVRRGNTNKTIGFSLRCVRD